MTLPERLRELPDDALVPVRWIRSMLAEDAGTFDGIPTAEASSITGIPERKLRRLHDRWERATNPPIRVSRKGDAERSDKLFDRGDCYRWRRENGGAVRVLSDPDDPDAIADALLAEG